MELQSAIEFARKMRSLARRADSFGYSRQQILEAIIDVAQNYEEVAERVELQMIIQMQNDWVEAS
jgi:hypothetical protein